MGLYVEYDAAGCSGTASTGLLLRERSRQLIAMGVGALVTMGAMGVLSQFTTGPTSSYLAIGMTGCLGLGVGNAMLSWGRTSVRFVVERGVLRVTDIEGEERIAELAGARILRLPDGVVVNPRLGSPVTIHWGRAKRGVADTLVEMLEAATERDLQAHGTSHNVPEQIRKMTE